MAGYSGTPLVQKLGIKDGHVVVQLGGPDGLLPGIPVRRRLPSQPTWSCTSPPSGRRSSAGFPPSGPPASRRAALWVCWPKRASKVPTDITEDVIREVVLPTGLVDVKVCAVDEVWSGLKLVVRRELRGQPSNVP